MTKPVQPMQGANDVNQRIELPGGAFIELANSAFDNWTLRWKGNFLCTFYGKDEAEAFAAAMTAQEPKATLGRSATAIADRLDTDADKHLQDGPDSMKSNPWWDGYKAALQDVRQHAQLEASAVLPEQHKAEIDEQLERLKANGGYTIMLTERVGAFGLDFEWVLFYLDESGERNLIPLTNKGICWNATGIKKLAALSVLPEQSDEAERYREALERIVQWADAYPLKVFAEPDFKRAHELLQAGGMTLDAISASNMRHVIKGAGDIARAALANRKGA